MNKHRLNLVISDSSKNRLERLAELTEAESNSDVIKNALRLYEALIGHTLNNEEILLRNKSTGEIAIYKAFSFGDEDTKSIQQHLARNNNQLHQAEHLDM